MRSQFVEEIFADDAQMRRMLKDVLPIAAVKFDRGFVQQLDVDVDGHHQAIATAAMQLADEHGVEVIAEGVETEAQERVLIAAGCDRFQGFLVSEPLDLGSFLTLAARRPR